MANPNPTFGGKKHTGSKPGVSRPTKLLQDMRWVYDNPSGTAGTSSQEGLRKLYRENFKEFISQMRAAEREMFARAKPGATPASRGVDTESVKGDAGTVGEIDAGEQRIEELIEELLSSLEAKT